MQSLVLRMRVVWVLLAVFLLAFGRQAHALEVIPMTLEETAYHAEAIFVGRVVSGQAHWGSPAKRWIVTDYTFDIEETILPNAEVKTGHQISLPFWGGTLGNEGQGLGGLEHPSIGQRYLLMLRPNYRGPGATPAVGVTHGLLQIVPVGSGTEEVREYEGQPLFRDAKGGIVREQFLSQNVKASVGVTRTAFIDWLRANLKRIKATPLPVRPTPDPNDPRLMPLLGKTPLEKSADGSGIFEMSVSPATPENNGFVAPLPNTPEAKNPFVAPEKQARLAGGNLRPQYVINRGAVVPLVFNQLPASFTPWSPEDQYQMSNWNYYGNDVFRTRANPTGTFTWTDGVSDMCGFISEATLFNVYGLSWSGGVLAWTSSRWFTNNNLIVESDVALNNGVGWTLDQNLILDGSTAYSYRQVLSHELGHAHGLGHENNYLSLMRANVPGMFAAFSAPFLDNTEAIRVNYPARTVSRTDLAIYLFYRASSGTWTEATFPSSVVAGNTFTVNDYQLENAGTATVGTPTLEWYLTGQRNYNAAVYGLGTTTYPTLARNNVFATNSVTRTLSVPTGTAAGDYYLNALLRNDEGANIGAFPFSNNYGWSRTKITVRPRLLSFALNPSTVTAGQSSTGTVTLSTATPAAVTIVTTSTDLSVAYPANVTVNAGQTTGTFNITTPAELATNRNITIGGSLYGISASTTLTILAKINAPINLTATSGSATQIDLAWQDRSSIEGGYKIERKVGIGGAWQQVATVGANATAYSDTSAAPSSVYLYRVRAYNGGTNSAYSNEAGARTRQALYTINGTVTDQGVGLSGVGLALSGVNSVSDYFTGISGAAILDNSTVENTITVPNAGSLLEVHVNLNITHTYIGDLRATLIAPDGTAVILHNRTGGNADNIVTLYPDVTAPAQDLAALVGREINGNWTLRVEDLAGGDTGVFNSWSLELQYSGEYPATVSTAGDGTYSLAVPVGDYTLTPVAAYYEFTPTSQTVSVVSDVFNVDFATIASANNSISGTITTASGIGIAGVIVQASDGVTIGQAITQANGTYLINGLPETTYTVTPIPDLYTFSPVSQEVTISPSATAVDFVADSGVSVVSGSVELEQIVNSVQPITFEVREPGGAPLFSTTQTLGVNGEFSLAVPAGTYDLAVKGDKWLRRVILVDASAGDVGGLSVQLRAGDSNNDNVVDVTDLLAIINHYNQTSASINYLADADFNCDDVNDVTDLLIVINNYNRPGDP